MCSVPLCTAVEGFDVCNTGTRIVVSEAVPVLEIVKVSNDEMLDSARDLLTIITTIITISLPVTISHIIVIVRPRINIY